MPYWDWAAAPPAGDDYVPTIVGQPSIQVITPGSNGKPVQISNPLYSYKFNLLNPIKGDFPNDQVCLSRLKHGMFINIISILDGPVLFDTQPIVVQALNLKNNKSSMP